MQALNAAVTEKMDFFQGNDPFVLTQKYGTPLYIYNERILKQRLSQIKKLLQYPKFVPLYSAKANSNPAILQIVEQAGFYVDAMSPGEIYAQMKAGFSPEKIFFVANNVSDDEMRYALERNVLVSADSISQLERLGRLNEGGEVAVRFNGGVGAGHHQKVVTAGKNTKFGVNPECIQDVQNIIKKYKLRLKGINQHIGSLFLEGEPYLKGCQSLLEIAGQFEDLDFIDFGGGFGISYYKQEREEQLDLDALGKSLDALVERFIRSYGKEIEIRVEPGRFIAAECGLLLGMVHSIKTNTQKYIGTDLGFNVLMRPVLYDSYHGIEVYRNTAGASGKEEAVTVVGNICESGDIIAKDRVLPEIKENDLLGVLDAGAYGHSMSSNYNNRLRPAEVLIRENNEAVLIRQRDSIEDLMKNYILLQ